MADTFDWPRIATYVVGEGSDAERRAFDAEMASNPALCDAVEEVRRIWVDGGLESAHELRSWDVASTWEAFARKRPAVVAAEKPTPATYPAISPRRPSWWVWTRVLAAAAALTIAAGAALMFSADRLAPRGRVPVARADSMYVVTTRAGQRLDLRMPDGSRVVLGVASTLRYPRTFGRGGREVYLDGRAYFDVVHDDARPFTVHAGHAVARDIGTQFDVHAYAEDSRIDVAVVEGVVELTADARSARASQVPVVLTAGQLGHVDQQGKMTARAITDLDPYVGWTQGRLAFVDAPLDQVVAELARWYDVDVTVADSVLTRRRVTGAFRDDALAEALQFLALSVRASYKRNGSRIVLFATH